jgi:hypothetical protein
MGTCVHFSRSLPSNSWWQTMAGWQALSRPSAAEGGGRRPAFTGLAIQPYSATEVDGWQHKLSRVSQNRAAVQADTEKKRIIPNYVFGWPRELRLAFIVGLMDSEGFVAANSNHTGRRFYMGFKSCDPWIMEFVSLLQSVGIVIGKIGVEKPMKPGYKIPRRFAIKMQSWVDSGARFNIARKQNRVDEWAAADPDPRGLRFRAKSTPETICTAPPKGDEDIVRSQIERLRGRQK